MTSRNRIKLDEGRAPLGPAATGARAPERVEYQIVRLLGYGSRLDQLDRLHRRISTMSRRTTPNTVLADRSLPGDARALLPAVEDRLMLVVVISPAQDDAVLHPH